MRRKKSKGTGFTLIELLIVLTILATLMIVVFAAINPNMRLKNARDAKRVHDIEAILTAVHQYIVDNKGTYPTGLTATEQQLGTNTSCTALSQNGCSTSVGCLDLSGGTLLGKYLKQMPIDPTAGSTYGVANTGYSVVQDANGLVTVKACGAEVSTPLKTAR
jgi:prepilin-type N-terminal cleavage/methylation domain-containing protein